MSEDTMLPWISRKDRDESMAIQCLMPSALPKSVSAAASARCCCVKGLWVLSLDQERPLCPIYPNPVPRLQVPNAIVVIVVNIDVIVPVLGAMLLILRMRSKIDTQPQADTEAETATKANVDTAIGIVSSPISTVWVCSPACGKIDVIVVPICGIETVRIEVLATGKEVPPVEPAAATVWPALCIGFSVTLLNAVGVFVVGSLRGALLLRCLCLRFEILEILCSRDFGGRQLVWTEVRLPCLL